MKLFRIKCKMKPKWTSLSFLFLHYSRATTMYWIQICINICIMERCRLERCAKRQQTKSAVDIYCRLAANRCRRFSSFFTRCPVRCRLSIDIQIYVHRYPWAWACCPYPKCHQTLKLMSFRANRAAMKKKLSILHLKDVWLRTFIQIKCKTGMCVCVCAARKSMERDIDDDGGGGAHTDNGNNFVSS